MHLLCSRSPTPSARGCWYARSAPDPAEEESKVTAIEVTARKERGRLTAWRREVEAGRCPPSPPPPAPWRRSPAQRVARGIVESPSHISRGRRWQRGGAFTWVASFSWRAMDCGAVGRDKGRGAPGSGKGGHFSGPETRSSSPSPSSSDSLLS